MLSSVHVDMQPILIATRCQMFGKERQQAKANLPAELVEEPHGCYYLQSIDTKLIIGTPDALRVFRPLSPN